jgi:predicted dehydrogenase
MIERALVVGCGSIGQRHIRNLKALGVPQILAVDTVPNSLERATQLGANPYDNLEAALADEPEAAIVSTPPDMHLAAARATLETGSRILIEKPIAASLEGVDAVLDLAKRRKSVLCVGYNLRFHSGLLKVKALLESGAIGRLLTLQAEFGQYLPDWRPGRDYRTVYNARATEGGGILLDASHEIDYARWLAGEIVAVFAVAEKLSDLELDAEDVALLTVRFASGVVGHIHLDCVARGYNRGCRLVGTEGTLEWDFKTGVRLVPAVGAEERFPIVPDTNEMYMDELQHFLACASGGVPPLATGADARRVLEIVLAARRSSVERRELPV